MNQALYIDNATASLYARYKQEREGMETIESDKGFITYKIQGNECFIDTLYIVPEARMSGFGSQMADQVTEAAKAANCTFLSATVSPYAPNATEALMAIISYGFKVFKTDATLIYLVKEII